MRLVKLSVKNYRSIKSFQNLRVEPLQSFVGENNAGKSNILRAVNCFLSTGAAGTEISDFNDPSQPIIIETEFHDISESEKKRLRTYLIGDRLILQKQLTIIQDERSGKKKVAAEYHGYQAEPKDWFLSITKIEGQGKTNWKKIAEENGILEYVQTADGKVTKASYRQGLEKLLAERDGIEYDQPQLGQTQALGIP